MNSCIYSGIRWLLTSGIQNDAGGVARSYRADTREYGSISPEMTGYYISALSKSAVDDEAALLEKASKSGRFLMEHAFDVSSELFPYELGGADNSSAQQAHFFDSGIVVRSLLHLWKATSEFGYRECAERCGTALQTRLSRVDGSFFPIYDMATGEARVGTGTWSLKAEAYQLKVGLAFLELMEATGNREFETSMQSLLHWSVKRHEGFLSAEDDPEVVMDRMHAYCYFLEGLLPAAAEDMTASQALQYGILRVENLLEDLTPDYQRCDVVAQLLRLRFYADRMGLMELDYPQAESEAVLLEDYQVQSTDPKVDGGFAFARRKGQPTPEVSPATTAFAIQALGMWEQAEEGAFRAPWQTLV